MSSFVKLSNFRIAILGYKSDLIGHWDPSSTNNGLPGSEEAVVYASQELTNKGYKVDIYMNPSSDSIWTSESSNPRWFDESFFISSDNIETYDLVLMWRRYDVNTGRLRGKKVFFWGHDSPSPYIRALFPNFDGSCILSEHHLKQLSNTYHNFKNIPYIISGNGIVPEHFDNPMQFTNPFSVGYFSNYARGLTILLEIWPDIKKEFPEAILNICYGRETWGTMKPERVKWLGDLLDNSKDDGIIDHGKIGHIELAEMMKNTSIWAYPCHVYSETYCITAIKCQAAGMIPVTSRPGGLDETVHKDAPSIPLIRNTEDIAEYKLLLLSTMKRIAATNTKDEREKYIKYARTYDWKRCTDRWMRLYNNIK